MIIEYLTLALTVVGFLSILILCLIGILTVIWWFKKPLPPADSTNRLNNVASWWKGLTRSHENAKDFHYFRQDLMDNINDVELLYLIKDAMNQHFNKKD